MIEVPFAFAFTSGMIAAVNPCGFAMLPAYLSFFVGSEADDTAPLERSLLRAVKVGLVMTVGFIVVFGITGLIASAGLRSAQNAFNVWAARGTIVIGLALAVLGVAMLFFGYKPNIRIPRLDRGGSTDGIGSMFLFGISYAIVSLSCAVPIFLSLVFVTNEANLASSIVGFAVYASGMGALITVLTLGMAVGRQGLVRRMRQLMPYVDRVTGAVVLAAGLWVAANRWVFLRDRTANPELFARGDRVSGNVSTWIEDFGTARIGLIAAVLVIGVVGLVAWRQRQPTDTVV